MGLFDLEGSAARLLADEITPEMESSIEEEAGEDRASLRPRIRLTWRPEDEEALSKIKGITSNMVSEWFSEAMSVIDEFYLLMRTPVRAADGVAIRTDAEGRTVWECDSTGRPREEWDRVTGQDIEEAITKLLRLRMTQSYRVNELFLDAVYARKVASDIFDDAWSAQRGDKITQGDKTATSNTESRPDKYHAYFRFCLYSSAKVLLEEVNHLIKHLENMRFWRVRNQRD